MEAVQRSKMIVHASVVGIIGNTVLVIFKAIVGTITGSVAIVADALNNLADAMSSIVTLIGTKLAGKAPDHKHPYGYGEIEHLSSVVIAVLILYTGVTSFTDSLDRILHPEDTQYDTAAIVVIAAGILVKIALGRYFRSQGNKTASEALVASGADAMLDAVVSSSILVGAAIRAIWGVSIDGWLGAAIAIVILKSGFDVLKDSLSRVIGERVPAETTKKIKTAIAKEPDVLGVYDLILNEYGPENTIGSVHVQVADDMMAPQIDAMSRRISTKMYNDFGIIMTVGIYAANLQSDTAREIYNSIRALTTEIPDILQVHGFYVDEQTKHVAFDLIIDFTCPDREAVKDKILRKVEEQYPDYSFSIVLDSDFSD